MLMPVVTAFFLYCLPSAERGIVANAERLLNLFAQHGALAGS